MAIWTDVRPVARRPSAGATRVAGAAARADAAALQRMRAGMHAGAAPDRRALGGAAVDEALAGRGPSGSRHLPFLRVTVRPSLAGERNQ